MIGCVYFFRDFIQIFCVMCIFCSFRPCKWQKKTQLIFTIQKRHRGILSFHQGNSPAYCFRTNPCRQRTMVFMRSGRRVVALCSWEVPLAFATAPGGQINSPTASFLSGLCRRAAAQSKVRKSSGIRPPDGVPGPRDEQQTFRRFPINGNSEIMTSTPPFPIILRGQRIRLSSGSILPAARETGLWKFQAGVIFREMSYLIQGILPSFLRNLFSKSDKIIIQGRALAGHRQKGSRRRRNSLPKAELCNNLKEII